MASQRPSDGGDGKDPRMPKTVQGLLQLCAGMSGSVTPNENTSFQEMTPEVTCSCNIFCDGCI